jgi:hypothetical protein
MIQQNVNPFTQNLRHLYAQGVKMCYSGGRNKTDRAADTARREDKMTKIATRAQTMDAAAAVVQSEHDGLDRYQTPAGKVLLQLVREENPRAEGYQLERLADRIVNHVNDLMR